MTKKLRNDVRFILQIARRDDQAQPIPVSQLHLWLHVNFWRAKRSVAPYPRLAFARVLNDMHREGLIRRVSWRTPCDENVWEWVFETTGGLA